ncbi:hypothetical protein RclHR1_02300008 [Rhizophagus clarus]|uniref:Sel1 repeat family protein n=1 Tax=Rhizophagus clarus TaxID=94130 RepID=A0A2Z6QV53_9GLOM|nr:hypothetical protein RclHR1_02300008 [Rhizophagus clarus]GES78882.1 Sel1 repeat family protein [Rhizophagus clarus]
MNDIIKINKKTGKKYIPCYDLHGYTTKKAYIKVKEVILECFKLKINSINFVTGRGNHPNVNGERGVLFKKFKEWLEDDEIINLVKSYVVGEGSYKVYLYKKKRKINKKTTKTDIKNESINRNDVSLLEQEAIFNKNETNKQLIIKEEINKLLNRKESNLSLINRKNFPSKESNSYTISLLNYDYVKTIFNLGRILLKRNNKKIGIGFIQEAAENGYEEAKRYLGEAYIEGRVIKQDYERSFEWILNAYKNNFEIEFYIAFLYKFGIGCKQDQIRSLYWFHRSAKHNHPVAQFYLGNLYINVDRKEALKWYTISAENGQANAQYILGKAYEMGLFDLDKNKSKSSMWYIKSAEQGHLLAKTKIDIQSETN